jgi:hypothetical protein
METQLALEGKSAKVLDQKMTSVRLTPYLDKSAAMGTFIHDFTCVKYSEHEGQDEGFSSQYYGAMQGGNGFVIMTNTDYGLPIMKELINRMLQHTK